MQYSFVFPGTADLHLMVDLASEAEAAGWDGLFYWDGIVKGAEPLDPWVVLSAIAMRTEQIRIGAVLVPLPWRPPWIVARATTTLDHLSNGRLILPIGLGAMSPHDVEAGRSIVGEPIDRRLRAELLDEGIDILNGLATGEPFSYQGKHYQINDVKLTAPVQRPRVPIWTVGAWGAPKSMNRAFRTDGWLPGGNVSAADLPAITAYLAEHRPTDRPFDVIWEGRTPGDDLNAAVEIVRPFEEAGVNWWVESMWEAPNGPDEIRRRIRQGPPRNR